jgi:hypothetical protein
LKTIANIETEKKNSIHFRSLFESAGAVMSERSLQWDMSRVVPGLQLRVGPSITGGLLEFVMDPHVQYDERSQAYHEEGTGKEIAQRKVSKASRS